MIITKVSPALLVLALALAGCGASAPPSATPADIVVCHQFFVYEGRTETGTMIIIFAVIVVAVIFGALTVKDDNEDRYFNVPIERIRQ
jgi:hypothetical protein